jgi:diacylglycerol kinase family enzyme
MLRAIDDAVLIYNPVAGRIRGRHGEEMDRARAALIDLGVEVELQETTAPGAATQMARAAVDQGRQLVIACGGDGTINEVVNGLVGSQVPLAVLPGGTANVLAKELGLPWDIHHAARLVPGGALRRIALGVAIPEDTSRRRRYFM